jgi:hypothetical protein
MVLLLMLDGVRGLLGKRTHRDRWALHELRSYCWYDGKSGVTMIKYPVNSIVTVSHPEPR